MEFINRVDDALTRLKQSKKRDSSLELFFPRIITLGFFAQKDIVFLMFKILVNTFHTFSEEPFFIKIYEKRFHHRHYR